MLRCNRSVTAGLRLNVRRDGAQRAGPIMRIGFNGQRAVAKPVLSYPQRALE